MQVVSVDGPRAVVEQGGARRAISTSLLDDVTIGEYVLVHAGYAIARVDEEEARRTLELVEQLAQPPASSEDGSRDDARGGP